MSTAPPRKIKVAPQAAKLAARTVPGIGEAAMVVDAALQTSTVMRERMELDRDLRKRRKEASGIREKARVLGEGARERLIQQISGNARIAAAALTGIRTNPSKAYENIVAAVKSSNGWINSREDRYYYGVLRGRFTGTYQMGPQNFQYFDLFDFGVSLSMKTAPLWRDWWNKRMLPVIGGLYRAVSDAAAAAFGVDTVDSSRNYLADSHVLVPDYLGDDEEYPEFTPEEKVKARAAFGEIPHRKDPIFWSTSRLHIMCEVTGANHDTVIAALKAEPRRVMSLLDFVKTWGPRPEIQRIRSTGELPTHIEDRIKYSRKFLETWSVQAATKAISAGVGGGVTAHLTPRKLREAKPLVRGVGRWISDADARRNEDNFEAAKRMGAAEYRSHVLMNIVSVHKELNSNLQVLRGTRRVLLDSKRFRDYLTRKGIDWIERVLDCVNMLAHNPEFFGESEQGRRYLQHALDVDLDRLYQDHDGVVALGREATRRKSAVEDAALVKTHKEVTSQYNLIPGVRPLVTREDYEKEGEEMDHCVAGYFFNRKSAVFSVTGDDGTRSTLELRPEINKLFVAQSFGRRNTKPSAACSEKVSQFIGANTGNKSNPLVGYSKPQQITFRDVGRMDTPLLSPHAERRFGELLAKVPFNLHIVVSHPSTRAYDSKEAWYRRTLREKGEETGTFYAVVYPVPRSEDGDNAPKWSTERLAPLTPFMILHRIFDQSILDGFAEQDVIDDAFQLLPEEHKALSPQAKRGYDVNSFVNSGVDTAAGRHKALSDDTQVLADLFAKWCMTGRLAFNPRAIPDSWPADSTEKDNQILAGWHQRRLDVEPVILSIFNELVGVLRKGGAWAV